MVEQIHDQGRILHAVHAQPPAPPGALCKEARDLLVVHVLLFGPQQVPGHRVQLVVREAELVPAHSVHVNGDEAGDADLGVGPEEALPGVVGPPDLADAPGPDLAQGGRIDAVDVPGPVQDVGPVKVGHVVAGHDLHAEVPDELEEGVEHVQLRGELVDLNPLYVFAGAQRQQDAAVAAGLLPRGPEDAGDLQDQVSLVGGRGKALLPQTLDIEGQGRVGGPGAVLAPDREVAHLAVILELGVRVPLLQAGDGAAAAVPAKGHKVVVQDEAARRVHVGFEDLAPVLVLQPRGHVRHAVGVGEGDFVIDAGLVAVAHDGAARDPLHRDPAGGLAVKGACPEGVEDGKLHVQALRRACVEVGLLPKHVHAHAGPVSLAPAQ
ncbi:ECRF4 [Macacine gammaherpesvirus 4]|uniref:ECRF4 n=1 Tax=Macacine gammaherpesvirus 4 TaxID=45455 RepID=Q8UZD6_9GAMA|nr:ECRF4 [Macacine gammaherpesvirus 4]AAK95474.1 ECRF4 [Macacine gammaherpesvirus 4]